MITELLQQLEQSKVDIIGSRILGKKLTRVQFGIMIALLRSGEVAINRREIIHKIGLTEPVADRVIDVHIFRIRQLFNGNKRNYPTIKVPKQGYRIDPEFVKELGNQDIR